MRQRHFRLSLALITALLVLLVAALAGGGLWVLRRMNKQLARQTATRSVLELGSLMAGHLAAQPAVRGGDGDSWRQFARLVGSLYTVEDDVQYVSVLRGGVVVFHQQRRTLDTEPETDTTALAAATNVTLSRRLLSVGDATLPVVVFSAESAGTGGAPCVVEVALRKEAVEREERTAVQAIASMFKVSLVTVIFSFGVCAALVGWMMHREAARERQRREEEHLAFAGVLANGIVHDFRNPMSSLRLDVQMIQRETARGDGSRPERLAALAARVRGTVDRMDKVFREFLYVSQPDAGAERETVDLARCVESCAATLKPRFEEAGLALELDVPGDGVPVLAYESSLVRALMNVITNAEQFSPPGAAVTVRVERQGSEAVVHVLDRGPGVPEADRRRIFEMFVSTRPGGTGLGLFLARAALERCGGAIAVHGREGGGSDFEIRLPVAA